MIKKEMVIMGCHRIGLGMNSVVKEAIEMFENEEIGLNACKKIIMACKMVFIGVMDMKVML